MYVLTKVLMNICIEYDMNEFISRKCFVLVSIYMHVCTDWNNNEFISREFFRLGLYIYVCTESGTRKSSSHVVVYNLLPADYRNIECNHVTCFIQWQYVSYFEDTLRTCHVSSYFVDTLHTCDVSSYFVDTWQRCDQCQGYWRCHLDGIPGPVR